MGSGSGIDSTLDAANILKPLLARGEMQLVGATTLNEYRQYIEKYPNFASGYINISSLYSSLGEDTEAFKAIEKAEILARSQNEKYLVEYNRAVLYYNKQNFSKALEHAQKAKAIKSGAGIDSLIEDIENSLK
jgi:tetratricopeptide (TPR) repeat protein